MSDSFYSIPNWEDLQHYKDRTPPWIKLHNDLLENYEFECLPDASKAHLLCIWLLASRTNNKIKADSKWIERRICANEKVDLDLLVKNGFLELNQELQDTEHDASKPLQISKQDACLEGEERESRVEGDKSIADKPQAKRFAPPTLEEAKIYFGEYAIEKKVFITLDEPQSFIDFYQSKNWYVGKNKMKDWKAAVRNWFKNIDNRSGGRKIRQDVNSIKHEIGEDYVF